MDKIHYLQSKYSLVRLPLPHPLFRIDGYLNPYEGCSQGCVYCPDSSGVKTAVRTNFLNCLKRELGDIHGKFHVGIGFNCEPYCLAEKKFSFTRHAIELIMRHGLPLQIFTKSELIVRDINFIRDYSLKGLLAVSVSISTMDRKLSKILEPGAHDPQSRMSLVDELRRQEIFTGITLAPVIPYVTDSREQVEHIFMLAKKADAQYILPSVLSLTNSGVESRLKKVLSTLSTRVEHRFHALYNDSALPPSTYTHRINDMFNEFSIAYGIPICLPLEEI